MTREQAFILSFWPLHFRGERGDHARRCSILCPLIRAYYQAGLGVVQIVPWRREP